MAGPRRGRTGGWVEDSGWAAESRFAGSTWQPLSTSTPLEPGLRDGTRIGASPADSDGALWRQDVHQHPVGVIDIRIYDMCVLEDAVARSTGDGKWPLETVAALRIQEYMDELDCDGDGIKAPLVYGYERGRYRYHGSGFDSREQAEAYKERKERQQPHHYSHTLPRGAKPMGLNLCSRRYCFRNGQWLAIEYAYASAPVDEVRVLGGSLAIRDGALRGLVRNWSRELWAYRVTVTAGDQAWHWPLSMQPGEAAPFEIDNWTGSDDPLEVEYTVTAQMSPDIDGSRMLEIGEFPDLTLDRFLEHLPQQIIDALPADTRALAHFYAISVNVGSHPSLARFYWGWGEDEWPSELAPLGFEPSAFSAWIDADRRVMEVSQITPIDPVPWEDGDPYPPPGPAIVEWIEFDPDGPVGFDIIGPWDRIWAGGANTAPALR